MATVAIPTGITTSHSPPHLPVSPGCQAFGLGPPVYPPDIYMSGFDGMYRLYGPTRGLSPWIGGRYPPAIFGYKAARLPSPCWFGGRHGAALVSSSRPVSAPCGFFINFFLIAATVLASGYGFPPPLGIAWIIKAIGDMFGNRNHGLLASWAARAAAEVE